MKNITKDEVQQLLEQNELENVTYDLVQAPFTHVFENISMSEDSDFDNYVEDKIEGFDYSHSDRHDTLNVTQRMWKIKQNGEEVFIMANPYNEDSKDEYKVLKITDLTKPKYEHIETRILSHDKEEHRVNELLAEKVGGWFAKHDQSKGLIFVSKEEMKELEENKTTSKNPLLSFTEKLEFANKFYAEVTDLKDLHLERFHKMLFNKLSHNASLIKTMNIDFDPQNISGLTLDIKSLVDKKISDKNTFFEKLSGTFDSNLDKVIKNHYNLFEDIKINKLLDETLAGKTFKETSKKLPTNKI